jgi:hypothetical protein
MLAPHIAAEGVTFCLDTKSKKNQVIRNASLPHKSGKTAGLQYFRLATRRFFTFMRKFFAVNLFFIGAQEDFAVSYAPSHFTSLLFFRILPEARLPTGNYTKLFVAVFAR